MACFIYLSCSKKMVVRLPILLAAIIATAGANTSCSTGFTLINGQCYYFGTNSTFDEAKATCDGLDANLYEARIEADLSAVNLEANTRYGYDFAYYIGGKSGTYLTNDAVSVEDVRTSTNGGDCYTQVIDYVLQTPCTEVSHFICQKKFDCIFAVIDISLIDADTGDLYTTADVDLTYHVEGTLGTATVTAVDGKASAYIIDVPVAVGSVIEFTLESAGRRSTQAFTVYQELTEAISVDFVYPPAAGAHLCWMP